MAITAANAWVQNSMRLKNTNKSGLIALRERRGVANGPRSYSPIHIPYNILTSADIKFGYFESSVMPSSDIAKEYIIGGSQSGSLS